MASGRIVVIAGAHATVGALSVVLGIGPMVAESTVEMRIAGIGGVVAGGILLLSGAAMGLRRGPARTLGIIGSAGMIGIGLLVIGLSVGSLDSCDRSDATQLPCYAIIGSVGLIGAAIAGFGAASITIIRRAHPTALRRRR